MAADMSLSVVERILDLARWAPSGDNTQPWRFEIVDGGHVVIHGSDTRGHCVYDLDGRPSQISHGALLETLAIAASRHGLRAEIERRRDSLEQTPIYDVRLVAQDGLTADPLVGSIERRSVQRRPLSARSLTADEKAALEAAVGSAYRIRWLEGAGARLRTARLMFRNAHLRLTIPEAYEVHRHVIEWNARYSEDRVPDQALGVDAVTTRLMRWVMASWPRVDFFNTWLGGTVAPRIQMDLLPGVACAAHFLIVARCVPQGIDDYVAAGRALQRFWLTATHLGLQLQPEMTPLIFARYVRDGIPFTRSRTGADEARALAAMLADLIGEGDAGAGVFMGRIGAGKPAHARSLRLALARLRVGARVP